MAKDDEREFRLLPPKPPAGNERAAWASAYTILMHHARMSGSLGRKSEVATPRCPWQESTELAAIPAATKAVCDARAGAVRGPECVARFRGGQKSPGTTGSKTLARCTITQLRWRQTHKGEVRRSGAARRARGGCWANQPTRSQTALHGAPGAQTGG